MGCRKEATKPSLAMDWRWRDAGGSDAKGTATLLVRVPGRVREEEKDLDGVGTGQIKAFAAEMLNLMCLYAILEEMSNGQADKWV